MNAGTSRSSIAMGAGSSISGTGSGAGAGVSRNRDGLETIGSGAVKAQPGALNGSGNGFNVTWERAS